MEVESSQANNKSGDTEVKVAANKEAMLHSAGSSTSEDYRKPRERVV